MSSATTAQRTEVIVFCSGKGGTGKTSLISALGYALRSSGHRVLFVDADRATDGLSLFVLGPEGREQLANFAPESTFTGLLDRHEKTGAMQPKAHSVHRTRDHGLSYDVIISDRYLYGDAPQSERPYGSSIDRQFERRVFQQAVRAFFDSIRSSGQYDYVLVDSRGGFSFESTDVAAAGDSFVVVTEATFTNFYQDRNLVDRIGEAAELMQRQAVLRGVIINKSTDPGEEVDVARSGKFLEDRAAAVQPREASYRNELVREFGIRFEDTYCVALDLDALRAYKEQKSVFRVAPASRFAYDALQAFQRILKVVTSQWADDRIERWDKLIGQIDAAIQANNEEADAITRAREQEAARVLAMEAERDRLRTELERAQAAQAQEQKRQDLLLSEFRSQEAVREQRFAREMEETQRRFEKEAAAKTELELLKARHESDLRVRRSRFTTVVYTLLAALVLIIVGVVWLGSRARDGAASSTASYGATPPASAASPSLGVTAPTSADATPTTVDGPVTDAVIASAHSDSKWLRPCLAGTYNVIVASGFRDIKAAEMLRSAYAQEHSEFAFQVVSTVSARGGADVMQAIFAGQGLSRGEASDLLAAIRKANFINGAYITPQTFDCAGSRASAGSAPAPARKAASRSRPGYGAKS